MTLRYGQRHCPDAVIGYLRQVLELSAGTQRVLPVDLRPAAIMSLPWSTCPASAADWSS